MALAKSNDINSKMKKQQKGKKPSVKRRGSSLPSDPESSCEIKMPEITFTNTSAEDCGQNFQKLPASQSDHCHLAMSPRPVTVHALFDWYFDSSDEGEELEEKSQSPEDLRKMFHNVLNRRPMSTGGDDTSRGKPEHCTLDKTDSMYHRHPSPSSPRRADNTSWDDEMDGTGGATAYSAGAGIGETQKFGRAFDEEEQLKGHYDDVIDVFKGVCFDLDNDDKHLTRMFSMPSSHSLDYK